MLHPQELVLIAYPSKNLFWLHAQMALRLCNSGGMIHISCAHSPPHSRWMPWILCNQFFHYNLHGLWWWCWAEWHLYWFDHKEENLHHDEHGADRVKCTGIVPTASIIVFRPDETSWCYAGYQQRGCSGNPVQQCDGSLDITHLPWYTIHKNWC